jgi:hypothetical protein
MKGRDFHVREYLHGWEKASHLNQNVSVKQQESTSTAVTQDMWHLAYLSTTRVRLHALLTSAPEGCVLRYAFNRGLRGFPIRSTIKQTGSLDSSVSVVSRLLAEGLTIQPHLAPSFRMCGQNVPRSKHTPSRL